MGARILDFEAPARVSKNFGFLDFEAPARVSKNPKLGLELLDFGFFGNPRNFGFFGF